jgi:hypothetical protein
MLLSLRRRVKVSGIACDLDFDWFKSRLVAGVCEVSGIRFHYSPTAGRGHKSPWAPSVDRKAPGGGYLKENCRLVVWIFNSAKSNYTDDDVFRLAEALERRVFERAIAS